jgi:hypothetical protein
MEIAPTVKQEKFIVTPSCAVISCSSLSLMTVLPNEQNGIITNKHKMTNEVKTFFMLHSLKF